MSSSTSSVVSPDAVAVLVLIESSGMMQTLWEHIAEYYLPLLLNTIRSSNRSVSMRVCWQTTHPRPDASGSVAQSNINIPSHNDVPVIQFDPHTHSSISAMSLRHAIEMLRMAFQRSQRPSRHLILVAASVPLLDLSGTLTMHDIALSMLQNDIRLHMILSSGSSVQALRDLHQHTLHLQQSTAITPSFDVDTSQYQILLSGDPTPSPGSRSLVAPAIPTHGSMSLPIQSPPRPGAVRTLSAPSVVSASSLVDTPVQETLLAAIPRVPRGKQPASSPPAGSSDPPRTSLVSYLQQMHGLTKKRTYGTKTTKRSGSSSTSPSASSSAGEPSRSTINRPILPRLDLATPKQSHGRTPYPKPPSSDLEKSPPKTAAVSQTAASSITTTSTPAPSSSTTPQPERGNTPRRFPWILPTPLPELSPGQTERSQSATLALRSLAAMSLRQTDFSTHGGPSSHSHDARVSTSPTGYSPPQHPIVRGSQDDQPELSHTMQSGSSPPTYATSLASLTGPNPISSGQYGPGWSPSQIHEYGPHPHDIHTQLHTVRSQYGTTAPMEDPGDQPFIITPEYQARADAQFAEALRSGAIEAQMTSATLSPNIENPHTLGYSTMDTTGYFPNLPHREQNPGSSSALHSTTSTIDQPQIQASMPLPHGYYYGAQDPTYAGQDPSGNAEHEDHTHPSSSSGPSPSHHRYHDGPPYDSSADRWYGT